MELPQILTYVIIPLVIGMGTFIVRSTLNRLDILETKIEQKVSESAVRTIMDDKLDPIREDVKEIKETIKNLYDLYVQNGKSH
jgi:hypothetical protein